MDAARAFYTEILGPEVWGPDVSIAPLPERARSRGAKPHWLGHIGVRDVEATAAQLVAMGAEQLGSAGQPGGESRVILRDPFGTIVALTPEPPTQTPPRSPVVWHILHTRDHERAFAEYARLFGWTAKEALDMGPELGRHQLFAWDDSGRNAGSVADTARQAHIHTQWMFFFPVADIAASLEKVRALGGLALPPRRTKSGDLAAPCDDPQGGAFALYQFASATPGQGS
jgi:hypothetical protein